MKLKGYKSDYPIRIYNEDGNLTYIEDSEGYWSRREYENGNLTYLEDSDGYWERREYENGNETYYEDSYGTKIETPKTCEGKEVEIDGKTYILKEK